MREITFNFSRKYFEFGKRENMRYNERNYNFEIAGVVASMVNLKRDQ